MITFLAFIALGCILRAMIIDSYFGTMVYVILFMGSLAEIAMLSSL